MSPKMFNRWPKKQLLAWIGQILLLFGLVTGISLWQQKDLLDNRQQAPGFSLMNLNGDINSLREIKTQRTLLYFFAPWCSICKLSIGNLDNIAAADPTLTVVAIALGYHSPEEVDRFVADQQLQVPVLLGTRQTQADYSISLFPTYYVLDESKQVVSKSVGYSTEFGMKARTW